jgi:hypothetical protein
MFKPGKLLFYESFTIRFNNLAWSDPKEKDIAASNMPIRSKAKFAGARWNPEKQLWYLNYGQVVGTELEKYIDVDGFDNKA